MVELPQLGEMLLAVESTEVAEQNKDRRSAKQPTYGEHFAVQRKEVQVEIDPHSLIVRQSQRQCVIHITIGHWLSYKACSFATCFLTSSP